MTTHHESNSTKPILSIYIPTYNRSTLLYRQLSSLWALISVIPDSSVNVEVIIADNCSTDQSQLVCEHFKGTFYNLCPFYVTKNSSNIGAIKNFFKAPKICRGKYIWILGDDDIVLPTSFKDLYVILCRNNYDIIFSSSLQDPLPKSHEIIVRDLFFKYPMTSVAHISRVIYKKSLWDSFVDKINEVPSYYVWPLIMPLLPVLETGKGYLYSSPLIYSTKDGGLDIWKNKTSLARIAEFFFYCQTIGHSRDELGKLLQINFPSADFIAKKYFAACISFPNENLAYQQLKPLLKIYKLNLNIFVLLGDLCRSRWGALPRKLVHYIYNR